MPALHLPPPLRRVTPAALPLLLLLLLAGLNALAVMGIVTARRNARLAALQDLRLETEGHARSVESSLATLRRQLVQFSRRSELRGLLVAGDSPPGAVTAAREAAAREILVLLQDTSAVAAVALRDQPGAALLLATRRGGEPRLLPLTSDPPAPIADPSLFVAQLPVAGRAREPGLLEVWVDLAALLEVAAPGAGGRVELWAGGEEPPEPPPGLFQARATVTDAAWPSPVRWTLTRRENESQVLESVTDLATRYRRTMLLNLGVITSTLLVGWLSLRQMQRAATLAAENRQQTRLRELERRMLHSDRLARVGRMAAGVAHEVNNPLEGMSNYLTLLEEDLAAGEVEGARRLVPRVREGLDRVAAVIRGMLALSDPGRGEKRPLDLRLPVEQAMSFMAAQRVYAGVTLRADLADEPVTVEGNATTLGQLVLNLLLNAAQCQPAGGEVEIRCGVTERRAIVRVADRGPGFPPEASERLFEPFYSTRGSTGLGLAVCHSIALDHGGTLQAGNRPDGGAEVILELPLATAEQPASSQAQRSSGEGRAPGRRAGRTTATPGNPR
jgi:signal transduction histidine kinase